MDISATIIVRNEEKNIEDCLASLDFAKEIVVVDSGSTDNTESLCRANPKVSFFQKEWPGFGAQKNFAAEQAKCDWIFNIDADERVSPKLKASILEADFISFNSFRVARENYFGGRWIKYCGWYPDYNLRLYNKNKCRFRERLVHESLECCGPVGTLSGNLIHFTYSGISDYLLRMERYSTLAAEQMVIEGKMPSIFDVILRPIFTFVKMFVIKRGMLEGYHGILLSALYSIYTFIKYAKAKDICSRNDN